MVWFIQNWHRHAVQEQLHFFPSHISVKSWQITLFDPKRTHIYFPNFSSFSRPFYNLLRVSFLWCHFDLFRFCTFLNSVQLASWFKFKNVQNLHNSTWPKRKETLYHLYVISTYKAFHFRAVGLKECTLLVSVRKFLTWGFAY